MIFKDVLKIEIKKMVESCENSKCYLALKKMNKRGKTMCANQTPKKLQHNIVWKHSRKEKETSTELAIKTSYEEVYLIQYSSKFLEIKLKTYNWTFGVYL